MNFFFDMNIKSESLGQEDVDPIASNKGKSAIVAEVEMPMDSTTCIVIKSKIPSAEEPNERVTNGHNRIGLLACHLTSNKRPLSRALYMQLSAHL